MKTKLWSLTLGNFAIGTGAMVLPGMLNELTRDLNTTPAAIGVVVSGFALTVCVGGPFLASWTSTIERRKLLTAALVLYAVMHVCAALSPNYGWLLALRIVTAVGAAIFTSQAAATAGLLVPTAQRGGAIGLVFLGWSIAAVLGVPLGSWLGSLIGWRWTMALVGLVSALIAAWVWRQIPSALFVVPMDRAAWKSLRANRPLLLAVLVTAVQASGQFTVFTYLALLYKEFNHATPETISLLYACFGVAGLTGNILANRMMDRLGPARVAMTAMTAMALGLLCWPLASQGIGFAAALTFLWGLGCFAVNGAQQARLVALAPPLASASVALNSSALYLGQAFGALSGAAIIGAMGLSMLAHVGAGLLLCALVISQWAWRLATRAQASSLAVAQN
jgi:predicted MFS family arabinose efflux permease